MCVLHNMYMPRARLRCFGGAGCPGQAETKALRLCCVRCARVSFVALWILHVFLKNQGPTIDYFNSRYFLNF